MVAEQGGAQLLRNIKVQEPITLAQEARSIGQRFQLLQKTARAIGQENLRKPEIQAAISAAQEARSVRAELSKT